MDNTFITEYFDWKPVTSNKVKLLNDLLSKMGRTVRVQPLHNTGRMTNVEQRMNIFHLVSQVLVYGVPGDLVEVGTHTGETAALIRMVMDRLAAGRKLHVYDLFAELDTSPGRDTQATLIDNFRSLNLELPIMHKGWFEDTLPHDLPDSICFAHIDAGPGRSEDHLRDSVLLALREVYPRLNDGAICVLMDYCDPDILDGWNLNPGVKKACDVFFENVPEEVSVLYAGDYSHGYFRKGLPASPSDRAS